MRKVTSIVIPVRALLKVKIVFLTLSWQEYLTLMIAGIASYSHPRTANVSETFKNVYKGLCYSW